MSTRSWAEVRADMDLDEDRVAAYRARWLDEIEKFPRPEEGDGQMRWPGKTRGDERPPAAP